MYFVTGAVIPTFTLSGSGATLYIEQYAVVNITSAFNWDGGNCAITNSGGSTGTLNLLATCASSIRGYGSGQTIGNVVVFNYGRMLYIPTDAGLQVSSLFVNAPGEIKFIGNQ